MFLSWKAVSRSMASGSFNIETLSVHKILPLQTDVIPYSTNTVFSVGPSSFLEGYSPYQWFSTNNYMDPSTMSTAFVSTTNEAIRSTLKAAQPYTSSFSFPPMTINFTGIQQYPVIFTTPSIQLGKSVQDLISTNMYDVTVESDFSLSLSLLNDSVCLVSTVGIFGETQSASNTGLTTTTRVGPNTFTNLHTKFIFPANSSAPLVSQSASTFYYQITLLSTNNATSVNGPQYSFFMSGQNTFSMTFQPRLSL